MQYLTPNWLINKRNKKRSVHEQKIEREVAMRFRELESRSQSRRHSQSADIELETMRPIRKGHGNDLTLMPQDRLSDVEL